MLVVPLKCQELLHMSKIPSTWILVSKISGTGLDRKKQINVDVKKVVPFMTWKGDPSISFCVGESIRNVHLCKQTRNMSTRNDVRNKDITKVQ